MSTSTNRNPSYSDRRSRTSRTIAIIIALFITVVAGASLSVCHAQTLGGGLYGGTPLKAGGITLTAQAAAIGTTALLVAPTPGTYRVCFYHEITTAASVSSATQLTLSWTAAAAATTTGTNVNTNVVGAFSQSCVYVKIASGNLNYAATYATSAAGMQFALNITAWKE